MQKLVKNYLDEFNKRHKRNRRAILALLLMAVLVVGGVLGTLSQYGVALEEPEKKPLCGLEEHTHTEECYQDVLICGYGEGAETEAEAEPKQEPAAQEQVERVLSCGQEEQGGHQHSESCYETKSELTCGQEEGEGHTHSESCYGEDGALTCGQEENEGHIHSDGCYTEEEVLVCSQAEGEGAHTHTEACYTETVSAALTETTPAGQESSEDSEEAAENHTHTEACYERRLVCGLEEHTHTEACYIDGLADVETASDWEEMFADVEWKEQWGEDLVTAAQMQIGYQESQTNYQSEEDGTHKGYTRYGAFMDDPYMDWNAAFVNFCLYYAGLNEEDVFPEETNAGEWYKTFVEADENNADYITLPEEYEPKAGDIVFLEDEENGEALMGIVSSYDGETGEAKVIAGDNGDEVTEETYVVKGEVADESPINSYLMTTELEDHIKNNTRIMRAEGEDYTVTVRFTDAAEIPNDAVLNVREIEKGTDEYQTHYEQSLEAMGAEELSFARYFDITFLVNDEKIEPKDTVNVTITYADPIEVNEDDKLGAVHFKNDGEIEVLDVESNLKGDAAVVSEEEAGSGPEEETTGTFFRFEQNSFSTSGTVAALSAADNTRANGMEYTFCKCDISEPSDLEGRAFLITNFTTGRERIMTGTVSGEKAVAESDISESTKTLFKNLDYAWQFEKSSSGNGYYLYNIGQKKYLRMLGSQSDSTGSLSLQTLSSNATVLTVEVQNDGSVAIFIGSGRSAFRLNNSGSGTEFIAYREGKDGASGNEKLTLFKLQKAVTLNPYNIGDDKTENRTTNSPYRFIVDGSESHLRLSLGVVDAEIGDDKTISFPEETKTIYLPSNVTRTTGFDLLQTEGGKHYIENVTTGDTNTKPYLWKLKGWYNIADGKYYSVEDKSTSVEATVNFKNENGEDVYNVFYADWVAASYNNGNNPDNLGGIVDKIEDTSKFVTTELFDYNELVNITLKGLEESPNMKEKCGKSLEQTAEGEKWTYTAGNVATMMFGNHVLGEYDLGTSKPTGGNPAFALGTKTENEDSIEKILETLFDPNEPMGVTYLGVADKNGGLFQHTTTGYNGYPDYVGYYYDSDHNAASFNRSQGKFYVYKKTQSVKNTTFLPLNDERSSFQQNNATANYWFGMKTQIDYWLDRNSNPNPSGGEEINYIDGKPMIFEFTGDDDVWVFDEYTDKDGSKQRHLILNLSSCHAKWSGSINFSTGVVTKNGQTEGDPINFTSGAHKLTVYYLERGSAESNCAIRFNLRPYEGFEGTGMQKIIVKKQWVDEKGNEYPELPDKIKQETVSVSLYEVDKLGQEKLDDSKTEATVDLKQDNNWTYTWYRPKGKTYTVKENDTPESSYIMSGEQPEPDKVSGAFWIENSNLNETNKIVIGNGLSNGSGKVLQVNVSDGTASIAQVAHDAVLGNSGVLRNDDDVDGGVPLNQQWVVCNGESDNAGNRQFQLKSAVGEYYLYIAGGELALKTNADDASTFYFDVNRHLTGTSTKQLVVDQGGEMQVVLSASEKDECVHLYRYEKTDEKLVTKVAINNKLLTANLQIKKVNRASESDLALSGAVFELYRVEKDAQGNNPEEKKYPDDAEQTLTITTGNGESLGMAEIGSLPAGTYHLKETKAPTDYALLTEPIVITVSKEGTGTEAKAKVEVNFNNAWADGNEGFETVDGETGHLTYADGTFTIEVPNVLLYELPSTGGIGTYWYTIGGTLLLMAAALVLYKRKYAGRY